VKEDLIDNDNELNNGFFSIDMRVPPATGAELAFGRDAQSTYGVRGINDIIAKPRSSLRW
jgi:hypothetical protein